MSDSRELPDEVAESAAGSRSAPAGWYDDGSGRQRWFDGLQWTEHYAPQEPVVESTAQEASGEAVTSAAAVTTAYQLGDVSNGYQLRALANGEASWVPLSQAPATPEGTLGRPKSSSNRVLGISAGVVGGVILLSLIVSGMGNRAGNDASPAADTTVLDTPAPAAETVAVPPGLVGMTATEAQAALVALGLKAVYEGEPTAKVLSVSPATATVEAGSTVKLTVEQPPPLTMSQKNAIGSAESYLRFSNFSRSGLIGQLEYEGYSTEDASFAVDKVNPDWNAQAAGSAESYLSFSSFSREGLYEQLIYEGFTPEQAEAGLVAVGY